MFIWGGSFIAIKVGLRYLTPVELLLARFIPSAVMILPIAIWRNHRLPAGKGLWQSLDSKGKIGLLVIAFLTVPGYHFCLNIGETIVPAGWASLVISLNPTSIVIFSVLMLREPVGVRRLLGILCSFAALVFIALNNDLLSQNGQNLIWWMKVGGLAIVFGSVVSFGSSTVLSKRLITNYDPLIVLTWALNIGTLFILPGLRFNLIDKLLKAPAELWLSILYLSAGCTVFGFVAWYWALKRWQASRAGVFIYLVPLFALIQGYIFLDEPLNMTIFIGAIGVIGGVILAGSKGKAFLIRPTH